MGKSVISTLVNVNMPEMNDVSSDGNVNHSSKDDRAGVSVDYISDPTLHWHVLRITFGRLKKAVAYVERLGYDYYMPTRMEKIVVRDGEKAHTELIESPIFTNMLFIRTSSSFLYSIFRNHAAPSFVTPYYNHLKQIANGNNPYLTILDGEFANFRKLVETHNENIIVANAKNPKFSEGQLVEIIDGEFKGVVGRVARYKGQQRVFVELQGLCMVATAYIPTACLKHIEESE